jgi:hypothetical protein
MSDNLKKKFGADNWYDWQNINWSTKWDTKTYGNSAEKVGKTIKALNYDFDTAWSPPQNALINISKSYPKLTFKLEYSEGGMCFSGEDTIKNGEVLETISRNSAWKEDEPEDN